MRRHRRTGSGSFRRQRTAEIDDGIQPVKEPPRRCRSFGPEDLKKALTDYRYSSAFTQQDKFLLDSPEPPKTRRVGNLSVSQDLPLSSKDRDNNSSRLWNSSKFSSVRPKYRDDKRDQKEKREKRERKERKPRIENDPQSNLERKTEVESFFTDFQNLSLPFEVPKKEDENILVEPKIVKVENFQVDNFFATLESKLEESEKFDEWKVDSRKKEKDNREGKQDNTQSIDGTGSLPGSTHSSSAYGFDFDDNKDIKSPNTGRSWLGKSRSFLMDGAKFCELDFCPKRPSRQGSRGHTNPRKSWTFQGKKARSRDATGKPIDQTEVVDFSVESEEETEFFSIEYPSPKGEEEEERDEMKGNSKLGKIKSKMRPAPKKMEGTSMASQDAHSFLSENANSNASQ